MFEGELTHVFSVGRRTYCVSLFSSKTFCKEEERYCSHKQVENIVAEAEK